MPSRTAGNINDGCGATAPGAVSAAVVANGDELGIALDGDGDRVIAADHRGGVVDGDHLLALEALRMFDAGELARDTLVVTSCRTSGCGSRCSVPAFASSRPASATVTCSRL
jgi:phosphoglucosamine mutase